jgi:hypothetical protein
VVGDDAYESESDDPTLPERSPDLPQRRITKRTASYRHVFDSYSDDEDERAYDALPASQAALNMQANGQGSHSIVFSPSLSLMSEAHTNTRKSVSPTALSSTRAPKQAETVASQYLSSRATSVQHGSKPFSAHGLNSDELMRRYFFVL